MNILLISTLLFVITFLLTLYIMYYTGMLYYNIQAETQEKNVSLINMTYKIVNGAQTDMEKVEKVTYWVAHNIKYKKDKRNELILYPEILKTGGDCEDFSVLIKSMLDILNIKNKLKLKLIKNNLLHMYNLVYINNKKYEIIPYYKGYIKER